LTRQGIVVRRWDQARIPCRQREWVSGERVNDMEETRSERNEKRAAYMI